MNIGRPLTRHAKFRRKHPALIFGNERLTFESFLTHYKLLQCSILVILLTIIII
jgi:hypothetical protein